MHFCTMVDENVSVITSENPFKFSVHITNTSFTPRFFKSLSISPYLLDPSPLWTYGFNKYLCPCQSTEYTVYCTPISY